MNPADYVKKLAKEDIVFISAAASAYQAGEFNFRMLRSIVSKRVNAERPLRGSEVEQIVTLCHAWFNRAAAEGHIEWAIDADRARAELARLRQSRRDTFLPHLSTFEPRADDFKLAAAVGLTGGIVDRELFLAELTDREVMLGRMGAKLHRVTVDLEEFLAVLDELAGPSRTPAHVAAAAEALMFPHRFDEIKAALSA